MRKTLDSTSLQRWSWLNDKCSIRTIWSTDQRSPERKSFGVQGGLWNQPKSYGKALQEVSHGSWDLCDSPELTIGKPDKLWLAFQLQLGSLATKTDFSPVRQSLLTNSFLTRMPEILKGAVNLLPLSPSASQVSLCWSLIKLQYVVHRVIPE